MGGFGLPAALVIVGGIGWFGIFRVIVTPLLDSSEPWEQIAQTAADRIGNGAMVIADNPSFLFYLSNILHLPTGPSLGNPEDRFPTRRNKCAAYMMPHIFFSSNSVGTSQPRGTQAAD